jgi:hypothetical protein
MQRSCRTVTVECEVVTSEVAPTSSQDRYAPDRFDGPERIVRRIGKWENTKIARELRLEGWYASRHHRAVKSRFGGYNRWLMDD